MSDLSNKELDFKVNTRIYEKTERVCCDNKTKQSVCWLNRGFNKLRSIYTKRIARLNCPTYSLAIHNVCME